MNFYLLATVMQLQANMNETYHYAVSVNNTCLLYVRMFRKIIPDFSSVISEWVYSKTRCAYNWLYKLRLLF